MAEENTIKEEEIICDLEDIQSNKTGAITIKQEEAEAKQIWMQQKDEC